eukprot:scaffold12846_cov119-Isochrysis_galbana.AAC.2
MVLTALFSFCVSRPACSPAHHMAAGTDFLLIVGGSGCPSSARGLQRIPMPMNRVGRWPFAAIQYPRWHVWRRAAHSWGTRQGMGSSLVGIGA